MKRKSHYRRTDMDAEVKKDKNKVWRLLRRCPLAMTLISSVLLVVVISFFIVLFGNYQFILRMDHPVFASILLKEYKEDKSLNAKTETSKEIKGSTEPVLMEDTLQTTEEQRQEIPTQYKKVKKTKENSPYYDDPGKVALTTDYPYITVDSSYYDDALFIGDSRIEGLHDYSGLTNATFYYKEGLTVYDMMSKKIATTKSGKKTTIPNALKKEKFNKIFIMIGINELGLRTTSDYAKKYSENLEEIRKYQPDAVIFIMGIMNVTTDYSNSSEVFNNVNINDKNVSVAGYANGIDIFYLDMNPAVTNKKGGVIDKYTWDGIHLKAEYYQLWVDFLNTHGLPEEMFPAYQKEEQESSVNNEKNTNIFGDEIK